MMDKSLYKGIWIFAEQKEGILNGTPLELLAKAIELKKINGDEITALLLGNHVEPLADTLISYGADQVIVIDHPVLKEYKTIPYTEATVKIFFCLVQQQSEGTSRHVLWRALEQDLQQIAWT
jgi:electron transfer flavoprotein alpha subunit